MKILKKHTKRAINFRNEIRNQIGTDKTIISDSIEYIGDDCIVSFLNVAYVNGYDKLNRDSIEIFFSGLKGNTSEDIKTIDFKIDSIIVTLNNSTGLFENYNPSMIMIKGKFGDIYLSMEDDLWLDTEDYKDIIV